MARTSYRTKAQIAAQKTAQDNLKQTLGISPKDAKALSALTKQHMDYMNNSQGVYSNQRRFIQERLDAANKTMADLSSDEIVTLTKESQDAFPYPMSAGDKAAMDKRLDNLKKRLAEKTTIYCKVTHVARSGMSRRISFFISRDKQMQSISLYMADAMDLRYNDRDDSVSVSGCGMDMGFATVYALSQTLYGNGYALKHSWL